MVLPNISEDPIESCLAIWRDKIFKDFKRRDITPRELSTLFQQSELNSAFFKIMDHEFNGAISLEEWTGCFSKLLGDSDPSLINWFVDKFNNYCDLNDRKYISEQDFALIVMDIEFGYRFSQLISPKSRSINTVQLTTALEMIASLSTDTKWLSWLKFQFTEAIKAKRCDSAQECRVTYNDFINNFSFKEPFLAERLFKYLDTDKSGYLSLHEFINGLEIVVNGDEETKMVFLFKIFDVDGDGKIDYPELRMLLKCCLEDSPSLDIDEAVDDLTTALFRDTDMDSSGDLTIDELKKAFKKHDGIYKSLTVSTSIWIKPKYASSKKQKNWLQRTHETLLNNRGLLNFWLIYTLIHIATSINAVLNYKHMNGWVICARVFGNGLNFNCMLILVLVLKKHFTWLRTKGAGTILPLDHYIDLHKIVGIIILVETLIHTIAHLINLYNHCMTTGDIYWTILFTHKLTIGFPTGVITFVILVVMLIFTLPCVRQRGYFQLFYLFHLLSIPWLLIMVFHGKEFWKWLLVPAVLYTIEKILRHRKVRSHKCGDTLITEAILLPSKVTHLVIKRPEKFQYKAGDYVFINIPAIARYEWHPFSISSVPECEQYIWLHIRAAGNWTGKLNSFVRQRLLNRFQDESSLRSNMRSRMSRILSDVTCVPVAPKRVSWTANKIMNQMNPSKENRNVLFAQNLTQFEDNCRLPCPNVNCGSNGAEQVKRKSILKVMSRDSEMMKSKDESNYEDLPTESTPKAGDDSNAKSGDGKPNQSAIDKNLNTSNVLNINLKEVAQMNSEDLEKYMNSLIEKKEGEAEAKKAAESVAIDMESGRKKNVKLDENSYIVVPLNGDRDAKAVDKSEYDYDHDALGYLKMYKKTNRFCIEQIPSDEHWRLQVLIDGPYGTASQDIFDAEHVVLIAAGIGITPYASILQTIMQRFKKVKNTCPSCMHEWEQDAYSTAKSKIKKVDFIWVTREQRSLEWFISMLSQMEIDQKKNNHNFMETHLYVTSAKRQTDLKSIGLHMTLDVIYSEEDAKYIEGLKQRTHFGRPNWDILLQQMIRKQQGKISVFFCGPPNLGTVLRKKCKDYNLQFKQENF